MPTEIQSNSESTPKTPSVEKALVILVAIIIGLLWANTAFFVVFLLWRGLYAF